MKVKSEEKNKATSKGIYLMKGSVMSDIKGLLSNKSRYSFVDLIKKAKKNKMNKEGSKEFFSVRTIEPEEASEGSN